MPTRTLQNELSTVNLRKSFPEYIELRKKDKLTLKYQTAHDKNRIGFLSS